jgi:hypothetical protein
LDKQFSYLVLALTNSQSTKYYIILRHALRDKEACDKEAALQNLKPGKCDKIDLDDDFATFGEMSIANLSNVSGIGENTIRTLIHGSKRNEGLLARICGLHSKNTIVQTPYKGSTRGTQKEMIWYDGPDNIVLNVPKVPQDICEAEADKFKQNWVKAWQEEDSKWNQP